MKSSTSFLQVMYVWLENSSMLNYKQFSITLQIVSNSLTEK